MGHISVLVEQAIEQSCDPGGYDSLVVAHTPRESVMVRTEITGPKYRRDGQRYASDTADAEREVIGRLLPALPIAV